MIFSEFSELLICNANKKILQSDLFKSNIYFIKLIEQIKHRWYKPGILIHNGIPPFQDDPCLWRRIMIINYHSEKVWME